MGVWASSFRAARGVVNSGVHRCHSPNLDAGTPLATRLARPGDTCTCLLPDEVDPGLEKNLRSPVLRDDLGLLKHGLGGLLLLVRRVSENAFHDRPQVGTGVLALGPIGLALAYTTDWYRYF